MHLVHPRHGSLLSSTVCKAFALVNSIHIHVSGCPFSISVNPGSATHFPSSTASAGLPVPFSWCLCALGRFRAVSHHMWPPSCINIFCPSQLLASLGGHQLELCSPEYKCKLALVLTQVFKCGHGNKGREQCALVSMGLLVDCDACMQLEWHACHLQLQSKGILG